MPLVPAKGYLKEGHAKQERLLVIASLVLKIEVVNDFLQKQRPAKSTQHSPLICLDNLE
jgi:hypothetical protein